MKRAAPRPLGHIGFEGGARFDQPSVFYGDEKYRGNQGAQMGLSSIKRGDEPCTPDNDRHGFGSIGSLLGVQTRNAKEYEQCAKQ